MTKEKTTPAQPLTPFQKSVYQHLLAGYQVLFINSVEEFRCVQELRPAIEKFSDKLCSSQPEQSPVRLYSWDMVEGIVEVTNTDNAEKILSPKDLMKYLVDPAKLGPAVVCAHDIPAYTKQDVALKRQIKNAVQGNQLMGAEHVLVLISHESEPDPELAHYMANIRFDLPDIAFMRGLIGEAYESNIGSAWDSLSPTEQAALPKNLDAEQLEKLARTLLGLTSVEASNATAMAVATAGSLQQIADSIEKVKAETLATAHGLSYVPRSQIASENEVGGYEALKEFVARRATAFTRLARDLKIDPPKGIALIGAPGTGKSFVGRVVARMLGLPLVTLDVGSMFDKHVGESERKIRSALQVVGQFQGAVLLVDEVDKAFNRAHEGGSDSGVSSRVLGTFLSWLNDNQTSTFVVFTANRTDGLPPELLRKGRLDEVFFVDLPTDEERRQILQIHLQKRGIEPAQYADSLRHVVDQTKEFVGAELEAVVQEAIFQAFASRQVKDPNLEELLSAAKETKPLAQLEAAKVKAIREYGQDGRARNASQKSTNPAGATSRRIVRN